MKRNMLAIVILAATLVNLTLSAVMIFTVIPKAKRTDSLIEKIVSAIDLETENGIGKNYGEVAVADQEEVPLFKEQMINLKASGGKAVMAQVSLTLTLNKKHDDYAVISPRIASKEEKILAAVRGVLKDYDSTEVTNCIDEINQKVLEKVQKDIFQSTCVIEATVNVFAITQ